MKFKLGKISSCTGRTGKLEFERLPEIILETPTLFLQTKAGVIPHLTYETLTMITKDVHCLSLSLDTTFQCVNAVKKSGKNIAQFIGMKEYPIFYGVHNSLVALQSGYNGKSQVSLWTKSGREIIDSEKYMQAMTVFQPDIYQTLCDSDTHKDCTKKRILKSNEYNNLYLEICSKKQKDSSELKQSSLLAVLGGGYDLDLRANVSKKISGDKTMEGFVLDGLGSFGPQAEKLTLKDISALLEQSLKHVSEDKLRIAPGCFNPELIWQMVKIGIDAFDSSLVNIVSDRGSAFTFHFDPNNTQFTLNNDIDKEDSKYEINLHNTKYKEALEPILEDCNCVACVNHTKSYIHHLLSTKELLAPVLLMMHNLHHYLQFFNNMRQAIKNNCIENEN